MRLSSAKPNPYQIVLPVFEGPLDLLLHLIRENKVDIYDIPIAQVTEQYMQYISVMESLDLDIAGEFVVMAATLLEIKSRMLLPPDPTKEEDEEAIDPRAELVERLIAYQRFKEAAELFREYEYERMQVYPSGSQEIEIDYAPFLMKDITPNHLLLALQKILSDVGEGDEEVTTITRQRISLRMRMSEVWHRVRTSKENIHFEDLFDGDRNRHDVVVTFLAVLELLRMKRISADQDEVFGTIIITQREEEE